MLHDEFSDKLLVKRLICHDEAAFSALYDLYYQDIFTYSKSLVKQNTYAEEIVQEVFIKVWLHRENLDVELSFKSYLFTITRNITLNFLRKAANDRNLREEIFYHKPISTYSAERKMIEKDLEKIKEQAIGVLPPRRKRIFEMSRFEGKSYEEISNELDISISTVKNQMSKALKTLREYLRVHGDITILIYFVLTSLW